MTKFELKERREKLINSFTDEELFKNQSLRMSVAQALKNLREAIEKL